MIIMKNQNELYQFVSKIIMKITEQLRQLRQFVPKNNFFKHECPQIKHKFIIKLIFE